MNKLLVGFFSFVIIFVFSSPISAQTPTKFSIGDKVTTNTNLNVRAFPSGTIIDVSLAGTSGTVLAGPITLNGLTWWQIGYDNGTTGWSADDNWLTNISTPSDISNASTTPTPSNQSIASLTPSERQALIVQIKNKIAVLQAQIERLKQEQSSASLEANRQQTSDFRLVRQLDRGTAGDDVRVLQEVLAADSSIYPEGLITGYYGPLTEEAVKRFQESFSIPQVGRVDPQTMVVINLILTSFEGQSTSTTESLPAQTNTSTISTATTTSATTTTSTNDEEIINTFEQIKNIREKLIKRAISHHSDFLDEVKDKAFKSPKEVLEEIMRALENL